MKKLKKSPTELKISLLSHGVSFHPNLFRNMQQEYYENQYVYGKTSNGVKICHRVPQALCLGEEVICAVLRRENSPYELKHFNNRLCIFYNDTFLSEVFLPEKPPYFDLKLTDTTLMKDYVAVAGEYIPGFFLYPHCYYFHVGLQCKFCSLEPTRKTNGRHMASKYDTKTIAKATRMFQSIKWKDIPLIFITTGTFFDLDKGTLKVAKLIKSIYDALDPKVPIHLLTMPPHDFSLLEEYSAAGVTSIAFNLEVYNKKIFKEICPGKEKYYGYDKYLKAFDFAVKVFGDYKVFCGFIWGLEPIESVVEGYKYFLDRGVSISTNVFHADVGSIFSNREHPTEQFIRELCIIQTEFYQNYPKAKPIFPVSMRSTLDFEIYRGDFL